MVTDAPYSNGENGRRSDGRFASGNQFAKGKGSPYARRGSYLRSVLHQELTDDKYREVVQRLISMAASGDMRAITELLDRVIGRVNTTEAEERLAQLEERLEAILANADVSRV